MAQLVERSLPISEVRSSNKDAGNGPFLKKNMNGPYVTKIVNHTFFPLVAKFVQNEIAVVRTVFQRPRRLQLFLH